MQARFGQLDLAEPAQRIQRIGVSAAGHALDRPHTVVAALQGQRQATQAYFGQRMARQQPRIHRQQHLRLANAHLALRTDAQSVQPQQRTAAGPFGLQPIKDNRLTGSLAQPLRNLLRVLLGQRQRLAGRAHQQRDRHQRKRAGSDRIAAKQAETAAQRGGHQERGLGIRD